MEKLYELLNRNSRFILYTSTALLLFPFLILSLYNHPASDDYCYTNFVRDNGLWAAQVKNYFIWTGRFTATFLLTVDPINLEDLTSYRVLPIVLIIFFGISIFILIKTLFPGLSKKNRFLLSFLIYFLYLYYLPNTAEAFYWRAGSITYQLASILSLFLFASIRHLQQLESVKKRIAFTLLASLLAVLAIGLNETSMIIILVVVFLWSTGWFWLRKKKRFEMAVILFFTIATTIFAVAAPGNAVRMASKPEKFKFLFSLGGAVKMTLISILEWIPMPVLLFALFSPLLIRVAHQIRTRYDLHWIKFWHLIVYGIFLFSFIALCFFPSFWSQGGRPPYRTVNVIYLLFIFGALSLIVLFFAYLQERNTPVPQLPKKIKIFLILIIFSILIAKPNNIKEAYLDLLEGTAYRYNKEMNSRYSLLQNCSQENLAIPAIKNTPETIFSSDLWPDPFHENYYYNQCLSTYFNIQSIYTLPAEE